jgi:hypothetical protein
VTPRLARCPRNPRRTVIQASLNEQSSEHALDILTRFTSPLTVQTSETAEKPSHEGRRSVTVLLKFELVGWVCRFAGAVFIYTGSSNFLYPGIVT